MSVLPKDELIFAYTRRADDLFDGTLSTREKGELLEPRIVLLHQAAWVRFVVETIRTHAKIPLVTFRFDKQGTPYLYRLDKRTIERIRDPASSIDDFIL